MKAKFDWESVATDKFHKYQAEAKRYSIENDNVRELALLNAGKAIALWELLEMAGCKPRLLGLDN